jgi:THAP domain
MPYTCAVAECRNTEKTKRVRGSSLILHSFPVSRPDICKIWTTRCKRKEKINIKNARICSDHFEDQSYVRDLQHELLGLPSRRKLAPDAIPTLFPQRIISGPCVESNRSSRFQTRSRNLQFLDWTTIWERCVRSLKYKEHKVISIMYVIEFCNSYLTSLGI